MNNRPLVAFVAFFPLGLASASAQAQTPGIEHQAVACVAAEKFPRIDARFIPNDGIAAARIVFQSDKTDQWWSVAMKPEGPAYFGVLPKPKKSLKAFRYYVEVTDKALGTSRTPDYMTSVVGSRGECSGKLMASSLGSAAVILQGPAGVATLPLGFASSGVVAAGSASGTAAAGTAGAAGGGGISTGLVVAGVGVAAAGAAVAVVSKGGGGGGTNYTGPVTGQWVHSQTLTSPGPGGVLQTTTCAYTQGLTGTAELRLEQTSGRVTGNFQTTTFTNFVGVTGPSSMCTSFLGSGGGPFGNCQVSGSPGDFRCTYAVTSTSPTAVGSLTTTYTLAFAGALSGASVSGTVTFGLVQQATTSSSNAATTIPVTLR